MNNNLTKYLSRKIYLKELVEIFKKETELNKEILIAPDEFKQLMIFEDSGIQIVSLNNQHKLNSMDLDTLKEFYSYKAYSSISQNNLPVFIGDKECKVFSSGGDLKY